MFEECQISFGKALCEKIAERVRAAGIGTYFLFPDSSFSLLLLQKPVLHSRPPNGCHRRPLTRGSAEGFTECTPKAVENRLYSWKKKNVTAATNSSTAAGAAAPETPKKTAARAKKDPATPKTPRAKKGVAAKKAGSEDEEQEKEGKVGGKKRGGDDEGEGEGVVKKVKLEEVGGDEGMGLEGGADGDAEVKEEV